MSVFFKVFLFAGIVFPLIFSISSVKAAPVDYTGSLVDMGVLQEGQYGSITGQGRTSKTAVSAIFGLLPTQNTLTLNYSFEGDIRHALLGAGGGYTKKISGNVYNGLAAVHSAGGVAFSYNGRQIDRVSSTPLALTAAQIRPDNNATVVIINRSSAQLKVISFLSAFLNGSSSYDVQYNVSAVPVPAALPMFGFGLAALAALRQRKKNIA
ncbi:MAG: VPLPA-CTERM sorting domain-containing protein [Alphaproteobacteria bacterium]